MGLPLAVVPPLSQEVEARYPSRLTLARPDQHVAWRGDRFATGTLRRVAGWRDARHERAERATDMTQAV